MPFYEYECDACEARTEVFHGMNERPDVRCERCNGAVRRVIFPAGVIFKGGGFYATEYGRSTHNNPKKSSSASSSGGEKKAESAPAATTTSSSESAPAAACSTDTSSKKAA
ncbi:MAG: zinc ribbon domain-containing protein [Candidatus Wallbacteria bacterium]|nr:zinc ribbon domain-containing protein [Candidatus Wallbacteria bacterium]